MSTEIQLPSNPCLERKRDEYQHSPESDPETVTPEQMSMNIMSLPPSLAYGASWNDDDLYSNDVNEFQQHDKHPLTNYPDEYERAAKKQEVSHNDDANGSKERKKPGRKPIADEPTTKRKAQNRQAQRAFRERKENHVKTLETRVAELEAQTVTQASENELLKRKLVYLQTKMLSGQSEPQQLDFSPPTASKDFTFEMVSPADSFATRNSPAGSSSTHRNSDSGYSTAATGRSVAGGSTGQRGDRQRTASLNSYSFDRPSLMQQTSSASNCPSLHSGSSSSASPASAIEQDFCAASLPYFGNETVQAVSADNLDPQNVIMRANEMFAQQQQSKQPQSVAQADPLVFEDPFLQSTSGQTPNFSFDSMQYRESSAVPQDFADLFAPLEGIAESVEDPSAWAFNNSLADASLPQQHGAGRLSFDGSLNLLADVDREPGAPKSKAEQLTTQLTAFNQEMRLQKAEDARKGVQREELFDPQTHEQVCNVMYDRILTHPKFESFDIDALCGDMQKHARCTEAHEEMLAVPPEGRLARKVAWMDMLLDHHASKQNEKMELQAQQDAFAMFCPKD